MEGLVANRRPYPSEIRRMAGIRLGRRYGLVRCPRCRAISMIRKGQATKLCVYCGCRFWLHGRRVIFQSDDLEMLRRMRGGNFQGGYYRPQFVRSHHLVRGSGSSAG